MTRRHQSHSTRTSHNRSRHLTSKTNSHIRQNLTTNTSTSRHLMRHPRHTRRTSRQHQQTNNHRRNRTNLRTQTLTSRHLTRHTISRLQTIRNLSRTQTLINLIIHNNQNNIRHSLQRQLQAQLLLRRTSHINNQQNQPRNTSRLLRPHISRSIPMMIPSSMRSQHRQRRSRSGRTHPTSPIRLLRRLARTRLHRNHHIKISTNNNYTRQNLQRNRNRNIRDFGRRKVALHSTWD